LGEIGLEDGKGGPPKEHDNRSIIYREDGSERKADFDRRKTVKVEIARILAERFGLNPNQLPARIFRHFDIEVVEINQDLSTNERSNTNRRALRARIQSVKSISGDKLEVGLVITHKERRDRG